VFEPALTIEPGETIIVETINHMTPIVRSEEDLHPFDSPLYREREDTGPIYVRGARPGDALAIHIEQIEIIGLPHAHGWGPLPEIYPQEPIAFPIENGRLQLPGGLGAPLAPMVGEAYTTPLTPHPPYLDHGGTMDFTEVRPGHTIYLPVMRDGGLLILGDVHAAQGDGELYGEAAECAADITVTISIDREYRSARPLVETPDAFISLASRGDLWESIRLATKDMTELLARIHGITRQDAYVICALLGSFRLGGSPPRNGGADPRCLVGLSVPKDIR